jgi:hypothetical protein
MPKKFKPYQQSLKRLWKLKPTTKILKDFYVVDIETGIKKKNEKGDIEISWCLDARPKRFIFAVVVGPDNFSQTFFSVEELKAFFLLPKLKGKKVYAHNGGGYDYMGIWGNIYDVDPNAIFNGKFICFTNGNCIFADSMNIFVGASIKTIGKMMGNEKLGMTKNFDYKKTNWSKEKEKNRAIQGCYMDCIILYDALISVFEFAGGIKITQASLSMNYYRMYHQPFHIDHNENTKFFWLSYYGGRCEAFFIGKVDGKVIDVNSAYPYWMKNSKFPNPKILKYEKDLSIKLFKKYLEWYEGCATLHILHKPTTFGFLPYKQDGKLLFPVGKISGTWNFPEIRYALEKGAIEILKVEKVIYSEPLESPFVSYVDVLNEMKTRAKKEGNLFEEDRAKRFSNSLYGKFAQRIVEESIYIPDVAKGWDLICEHQKNNTFLKLVMFNKKRNDAFLIVKSSKKIDVSYSIPSFASYITSNQRVYLLDKMIELHEKDNKILYCDTDGIFYEGKYFCNENN